MAEQILARGAQDAQGQPEGTETVSGALIEVGVYFLLLFTPFAFGGVEMWARGVIQVVAGLIAASWVLGRLAARANPGSRSSRDRLRSLNVPAIWIPLLLFLLLVFFQFIRLPSGLLGFVSPAADELYSETLPGYAEGIDLEPTMLPTWLLSQMQDRIPSAHYAGEEAESAVSRPPIVGNFSLSSRRTVSLDPFSTRQEMTLLLCYAGLFGAVLNHFRTRQRRMRLIVVGVLSASLVTWFGLIQKLTWNGKLYWIREGTYKEVFGPFVNRNSYAAFAATILPIALCMALLAAKRLREKKETSSWQEILRELAPWGFAAALIVSGVFASLSRGGIVTAILAMVIVFTLVVLYDRWSREITIAASLAIIAGGLVFWFGSGEVVDRVGTLTEGLQTPSMSHRIGVWERTVELIGDYTYFGTGLGTFQFGFLQYAPPGFSWWMSAHNEYLEIISDTGVVGGGLAFAGLIAWLFLVVRPGLFARDPERFVYIGLLAGLAGLLVHSSVSANLQVPANGLLVSILGAVLLGMVMDRQQTPVESPSADPSGFRRWIVAGMLVLGVLIVNTYSGYSKVMGFGAANKAEQAHNETDLDSAYRLLAGARSWQPDDPSNYLETTKIIRQGIGFDRPLEAFRGLRKQDSLGLGLGMIARGIGLNPSHAVGWFELAALYEAAQGVRVKHANMLAAGRDEEIPETEPGLDPEDRVAVAALLKAADLQPQMFLYYEFLAKVFWDRGMVAEAGEAISRSYSLMPEIRYHYTLEEEEFAETLSDYILEGIASATINRFIVPTMVARARAEFLTQLGRLPEAIAAYSELRTLGGVSLEAEVDVTIGKLEQQRGNFRESLEILKRAAESGDEHWSVEATYFLGRAHSRMDDHDQAVTYFREYLDRRPDTPLSYQALAKELEAVGQMGEAEKLYSEAIEKFPEEAGTYELMASNLERQGRAEEARAYTERYNETRGRRRGGGTVFGSTGGDSSGGGDTGGGTGADGGTTQPPADTGGRSVSPGIP